MSNASTLNLAELYDYMARVSVRESDTLKQLRAETAKDEMSRMQIAPEQGQFMALLVRLMGAKKAIEIGTFTGYSSICVARALPDDGKLFCCDVSEEWTAIARRYWEKTGVAGKIELHLRDAQETLQQLLQDGHEGTFDFAFIDADKERYDEYYEACLKLIRRGGLITIDNVLYSGRVADESEQDEETKAIRALNEKLKSDRRVDLSLLPIADGLTLARKR